MMHNYKECLKNSINMPITCNCIKMQHVQISFKNFNYINKITNEYILSLNEL